MSILDGDTMLYLLDSLMQSKEKIVLKLGNWMEIVNNEFNGATLESTAPPHSAGSLKMLEHKSL